MTRQFDSLTKPMQKALLDVVSRGSLLRDRTGYAGTWTHSPNVMWALWRRGLVALKPTSGCCGAVEPTAMGRRVALAGIANAERGQ